MAGKFEAQVATKSSSIEDVEKIVKRNEAEFFRKINGAFTVVSTADDITCYRLDASQRGETAADVFKTVARIPASVATVFEAMFVYKTRLEWDSATLDDASDDAIHTFGKASDGNEIVIAYTRSKPAAAGLISSRDFVDLCHTVKMEGGALARIGGAVIFDGCGEKKKCIRGKNFPCGLVCKPIDGEPDACTIEFMLHTKIGGWVPITVLNKTSAGVSIDIIQKLQKFVQGK